MGHFGLVSDAFPLKKPIGLVDASRQDPKEEQDGGLKTKDLSFVRRQLGTGKKR